MRRLVTRIKSFLAAATTSASPAPGPANFFHKLLGDAVPLTHLGDIRRAKVLQYFATDSCERLLPRPGIDAFDAFAASSHPTQRRLTQIEAKRHRSPRTRVRCGGRARARAALAQPSGSPRL